MKQSSTHAPKTARKTPSHAAASSGRRAIPLAAIALLSALSLPASLGSCGKAAPSAPTAAPVADAARALSGEAVFVEGAVTLVRAGQRLNLMPGDAVMEGDGIATARSAACEIAFRGIGSVRVEADTDVIIRKLDLPDRKAQIVDAKGMILAKVNKLANKDAFMIRSRDVACGVRGTLFSVNVKGDEVDVAVREGRVVLYPDALIESGAYVPGTVPADKESPKGDKARQPAASAAPDSIPIDAFPSVSAGRQVTCDGREFRAAGEAMGKIPANANARDAIWNEASGLKAPAIEIDEGNATRLEDFAGKVVTRETALDVPAVPDTPDSAPSIEPSGLADKAAADALSAGLKAPEVKPLPETTTTLAKNAPAEDDPFRINRSSVAARPVALPGDSDPAQNMIVGFRDETVKARSMPAISASAMLVFEESGPVATNLVDGNVVVKTRRNAEKPWLQQVRPERRYSLKAGKIYEASVIAWADKPRFADLSVVKVTPRAEGGNDVETLNGYMGFNLKSTPTRYKQAFWNAVDRDDVDLYFHLGYDDGTVCIRAFDIRETGDFKIPEPPEDKSVNMIANGDFSSGMAGWSPWTKNGVYADYSLEKGSFTRKGPAIDPNWHSQLNSSIPVSLNKGARYHLEFLARAEQAKGEGTVVLTENGIDGNGNGQAWDTIVWGLDFAPVSKWKKYVFEFTSPATIGDLRLSFILGGFETVVQIDDVAMRELK